VTPTPARSTRSDGTTAQPDPRPDGQRDAGSLPYEAARDELVDIVRRLESGSTDLEESLALWERGEALAARCQEVLDGALARLDATTRDDATTTDGATTDGASTDGASTGERTTAEGTGRSGTPDDAR